MPGSKPAHREATMRSTKLLVVLIGVTAAGPVLAENRPTRTQTVATTVTVLRGSSAPPDAPYTPPPREVVREIVYLPSLYSAGLRLSLCRPLSWGCRSASLRHFGSPRPRKGSSTMMRRE